MLHRVLLIATVATLGCSKSDPPKNELGSGFTSSTAGSGSVAGSGSGSDAMPAKKDPPPTGAAPKLTWKDADGELLIASDGEKLSGPCDMTGTLTPTEVTIGGAKPQPWNVINRSGRKFTLDRMEWVIEIAPNGDVTHTNGGTKTPLGVVVGLDEATLPWFAAFIVAAPMVQHSVDLAVGNTRISVKGAADLRAWHLVNGANKIAVREREDPGPLFVGTTKPAWDPKKVTVVPGTGKTYLVTVKRDDDAMKAAFDADQYVVTELDGKLSYLPGPEDKKAKAKPMGQLVMRKNCPAHDRAVVALVWGAFATPDGHAELFPPKK